MNRVFDTSKHIFILQCDLEFVKAVSNKSHVIEYRGYIYNVDPQNKKIEYIPTKVDTCCGAMYYGYSYLTEIYQLLSNPNASPNFKIIEVDEKCL